MNELDLKYRNKANDRYGVIFWALAALSGVLMWWGIFFVGYKLYTFIHS